jgi:hypothetical protein
MYLFIVYEQAMIGKVSTNPPYTIVSYENIIFDLRLFHLHPPLRNKPWACSKECVHFSCMNDITHGYVAS